MASLIEIQSFQNKYSENLLPNTALLTQDTDVNFTGSFTSDYEFDSYKNFSNKGQSFKVTAVSSTSNPLDVEFDFVDSLLAIAKNTGQHIFSFGVLFDGMTSSDTTKIMTISVDVYINNVLGYTFSKTLNPFYYTLDRYYNFAQSFNAAELDEINFIFKVSYPSISGGTAFFGMHFDAFQLVFDKINTGYGLPSAYTLPDLYSKTRTIVSATTILKSDKTINIGAGTFTQPLPTAVGNVGIEYEFINDGNGIITLDPDVSELIDGLSTFTLPVKQGVIIKSDGSNWIITDVCRRETINRTQWIQAISPTTVNNATSLNLLTLISNANKSANGTDGGFYELSTATDKILTKWGGVVQTHHIRIGFTITTGTDQHYNLTLRRYSDNSILSSSKINRDADTGVCTADFLTYTYSASDPFVIGGFYIQLDNNSGASVELTTGINLLIVTYFK